MPSGVFNGYMFKMTRRPAEALPIVPVIPANFRCVYVVDLRPGDTLEGGSRVAGVHCWDDHNTLVIMEDGERIPFTSFNATVLIER